MLRSQATSGILVLGLVMVMGGPGPSSSPYEMSASLAVINGRIWTADPTRPWAQALAVDGERILRVGSNKDIQQILDEQTNVLNAEGRLVIPGFIDAHVHLLIGGLRLAGVQLRDAGSIEEFITRIKAYAETIPSGTWITGGDWDHEQWGGELPQRDWIDAVTPHHPVWVSRLDGHMALANSAALKAARIDRSIQDVEGGTIVKDSQGNLTGIFKDNAMGLVSRVVPPPDDEARSKALEAAMDYILRQGVTSVHHMGTWSDLDNLERAHRDGHLRVRVYASVPLSSWKRLEKRVQKRGFGDSWLHWGGLKGFVDGSLGSHTAAFFDSYSDLPGDSGFLVNSQEELYTWIRQGDRAGLQVLTHAIGDRANHILLDIYQRVVRENGPRDRRFRIEHAQHLVPGDLPRFAKEKVIASMQPYHAIDDGRWAEKVIGRERCETTYAFRSLLDQGTRVVFGSDWFVAPPVPLEGIYAAVTRRTLDNRYPEGWIPEQRVGVEEALKAYTIDAAYSAFEEKDKGSLEEGKLADFAILDRNITEIPPEEIKNVKVLVTVVGGEIMFGSLGVE